MKYKILHLPTGTCIWQTDARGEFYSEQEYDGDPDMTDEQIFIFDDINTATFKKLINKILDRNSENREYFTGWGNSIPEHFEIIEVPDGES